ncbi:MULTISPECIES: iron-sulfur cluster assembly accessory protein [unclassified Methylophaga]|jgi:iron-sulfur cluster assembly protein|uniref:HesB/IscA family protein n=1 Tax=unclassified Methylophaga TaxID=2629249 RepID=UPI000C44D6DE|nr:MULTISPECIES: iron-sulfur cluster assembly accessory protein [unclassified Methylophaga]MAL48990.1 iron-sulfur cluster assembly protein IscA [Methylophaga sp.]MAP27838.1 iron-sulfur cluster assembly protein IscA [Methylophaga sp.]MBP24910.1 iron-sulfur cluster assembly protein IscA [Methylophaga sp.]MDX1750456.1 iron-sulfur cluster assembly accessory protein [Methylophaga sp.]HAD31108.1 iron-sulfur cluster assembly protein IscA [Methylophaga sp.]|tara:strand:+ start:89 stop:421 length:333 start_codon:yes stop_codon:yes gene_type:complete
MTTITLTQSAVKRVRDMVTKRDSGIGLRIGVVKSGCSGYSYALDYADSVAANDMIIEQDDVKVVVDKDNLPLLEGMILDFVKEGLNQSFKFINPNVTSECGCGESFSVTK